MHRKLPFPQMYCDPQSSRTFLLPPMVKGRWMLILISPRRSRGLNTILSSRRRYGIAAVKQALRATFDSDPFRCFDGPPKLSWVIQYIRSRSKNPLVIAGGSSSFSTSPVFSPTTHLSARLTPLQRGSSLLVWWLHPLLLKKLTSSGLEQQLKPNPRQPQLPSVDLLFQPPLPLTLSPLSGGSPPSFIKLKLFLLLSVSLLTYSLRGANIASDFGHLGITVLFGN